MAAPGQEVRLLLLRGLERRRHLNVLADGLCGHLADRVPKARCVLRALLADAGQVLSAAVAGYALPRRRERLRAVGSFHPSRAEPGWPSAVKRVRTRAGAAWKPK